jgi:hypothetical protein
MRRLAAVGLSAALILVLLAPAVARAAEPPPNDDFVNAVTITGTSLSATVDLSASTAEPDEPNCSGITSLGTATESAWYRFDALATGALVTSVTGSGTTAYRLGIYRDTGGGIGGLSYVYCRPPGGPVATGRVTAGMRYYVQVAGIGTGPGMISLDIAFYPPPANDMFAMATPVGALPWEGTAALYGATTEDTEPNECNLGYWSDRRSVWYSLYAPADGTASVETSEDLSGAEARLVVFTAGGSGWNWTTPGACSTGPSTTFPVQAGRQYYVQVVNSYGQGTLGIRFSLAPLTPPPNDMFANATPIVGISFTEPVDTALATAEPGEPGPCGGSPAPTVWYSYTATEGGRLRVWATGASAESGLFALYRRAGDGIGGLQPLGCGTGGAGMAIGVEAGSTYYVQAGFIGPYGYPIPGRFTFNASFDPKPPPPPNDAFADAITVTSLPFASSVDTRGATRETEEPAPCGSLRTAWYRYVASESATLLVDTSGSGFSDSSAAVYRADGAGFAGLSFVACAWGGGSTKVVVDAGATYYIQGGDYGWVNGGVLRIGIDVAPPPPPAPRNDAFADALTVTGLTFEDVVDNRSATAEVGEPRGCSASLYRTVWYRITPASDGDLRVDPAGSAVYDSDMMLYEAFGPGFEGLSYLGCSYHDPLPYRLKGGRTYYLQLFDAYSGGGTFDLHFTFTPLPDTTPPTPSVSGIASPYAVDARIAISGTATDRVDPAPVVACTLAAPLGGPTSVPCAYAADAWSLGTLGTYTFTVTATDAAGNTATTSDPFDVVATYPSVENLTKAWSSKATVAKDLVALLESARAAEKRGQLKSEASKLADFRAGVKAQSGKAFTRDRAELLIAFSYGL